MAAGAASALLSRMARSGGNACNASPVKPPQFFECVVDHLGSLISLVPLELDWPQLASAARPASRTFSFRHSSQALGHGALK